MGFGRKDCDHYNMKTNKSTIYIQFTCRSVFSTMIFSVETNRSTAVLGWFSPSGAYKQIKAWLQSVISASRFTKKKNPQKNGIDKYIHTETKIIQTNGYLTFKFIFWRGNCGLVFFGGWGGGGWQDDKICLRPSKNIWIDFLYKLIFPTDLQVLLV